MLELKNLQVRYGKSQAVHGVDLTVEDGEIVALLGRNGAGKSTTLKAVIGLLKPAGGEITYDDVRLNGMSPYRIARCGISYVPEERRVFANLSVEENLRLAAMHAVGGDWTLDKIYDLFPRLGERADQKASTMSGGEQQMLAIGRALASNPRIILLDEPLEGLAPSVAGVVEESIQELRQLGVTMLLVEQNPEMALRVADRGYVLELGRVVMSGSSNEIAGRAGELQRFLAI